MAQSYTFQFQRDADGLASAVVAEGSAGRDYSLLIVREGPERQIERVIATPL